MIHPVQQKPEAAPLVERRVYSDFTVHAVGRFADDR
jgi:hypothetical protein